jgi:hypothetical protein
MPRLGDAKRSGESMYTNKTSLSKARSYQEIGSFWDTHDLGDLWVYTKPARLKVSIPSEAIYCPVEPGLLAKLRLLAQKRGISAETLLNLWLQEKLSETAGPLNCGGPWDKQRSTARLRASVGLF